MFVEALLNDKRKEREYHKHAAYCIGRLMIFNWVLLFVAGQYTRRVYPI